MRMLRINGVVRRIIESQHQVPLHTIRIIHEQIRDTRAIRYEIRPDPLTDKRVLPISIRRRRRSAASIPRRTRLRHQRERRKN